MQRTCVVLCRPYACCFHLMRRYLISIPHTEIIVGQLLFLKWDPCIMSGEIAVMYLYVAGDPIHGFVLAKCIHVSEAGIWYLTF